MFNGNLSVGEIKIKFIKRETDKKKLYENDYY